MWRVVGYLAGIVPALVDVIQSDLKPGWMTAVGGAIIGATKTVDVVLKKRAKGAPIFRTKK
jgi:hypothetical protein